VLPGKNRLTPHGMERALNSPVENLLKRKKLIERIDSLNQKAFTLAASDPAESLKTAETAESLSRGAGYSKCAVPLTQRGSPVCGEEEP